MRTTRPRGTSAVNDAGESARRRFAAAGRADDVAAPRRFALFVRYAAWGRRGARPCGPGTDRTPMRAMGRLKPALRAYRRSVSNDAPLDRGERWGVERGISSDDLTWTRRALRASPAPSAAPP